MQFKDYIRSLSELELKKYADDCGTTPDYIKTHLVYANKEPRKALRTALSENSGGQLSQQDVLVHFGIIEAA